MHKTVAVLSVGGLVKFFCMYVSSLQNRLISEKGQVQPMDEKVPDGILRIKERWDTQINY